MNHLTPGEIYTFKLVSGEEITAKIFKNTDGVFEVTQPISMVLGPQGLQMMPSLFSSNPEKNVYINTVNIAMAAETREDVRAKCSNKTSFATEPHEWP